MNMNPEVAPSTPSKKEVTTIRTEKSSLKKWVKKTYRCPDDIELNYSFKKIFRRAIIAYTNSYPDIIDLREFDRKNKRHKHFVVFHKEVRNGSCTQRTIENTRS